MVVRMKGMDEFVWVLAIAVILVVIFMGVSALMPYVPGGGNQTAVGPSVPSGGSIATFSQLGFVGYSSSYAGQSVDYGSFAVGQPQQEKLREAVQLDLCAGLWCSRSQELSVSVPSYYMDTLRGVKIYFAIYDTNRYGDLVVKWNGREFYRGRAAAQDYMVDIGKDYVKDSNTLQIYADGPGLMFWASTIYTMRDFSVKAEYGPSVVKVFGLSQSELNAWNSGELGFSGTAGQLGGQLRVRMNGNIVYQGVPSGQTIVALNYTNAGPKIGENLLVFDGLGGGVFTLSGVQLKLYLLTNQAVKTKTFQLSAADYAKLAGSSGRITFNVNSIQRDGDMTMKLNGKYLNVPKPAAGANTVFFTKAEASQGANSLEITGSGYWDVGDVTVSI